MSMSWAYLFSAPGTDPKADRVEIERFGLKSILVPVPNVSAAPSIAKQLLDEGVVSIEVCGHFGTLGAAGVLKATQGRIPVGSVAFGAESAMKLAQAFSMPESGEGISWAYIFNAPGTDPKRDRVEISRHGIKAILVPVPDVSAAPQVAKELVTEGVVSIEICGYFGALAAADVLSAVECGVPVGAVMFGSESAMKLAKAFGIPDGPPPRSGFLAKLAMLFGGGQSPSTAQSHP